MGIFTYLKIAGVVIILGVCSFYVYNYHHMKTVIANQQLEIDNLKTIQGILQEKQKVFDEYITKREQIRKRVANEQRAIDKEVSNTTDDGLGKLYDRYRVRTKGESPDAQVGKRSGAKPPIK